MSEQDRLYKPYETMPDSPACYMCGNPEIPMNLECLYGADSSIDVNHPCIALVCKSCQPIVNRVLKFKSEHGLHKDQTSIHPGYKKVAQL